jgi:hypothetical protein
MSDPADLYAVSEGALAQTDLGPVWMIAKVGASLLTSR